MSQQQPISILKRFKDFFACKNVLALNYRYPGNIQRLFRLQKCLSSNPSKFSKNSKSFSPAKLSQQQPINILKRFKDLFACKNVLAATHQYSEKIQRLFRLQKCLSPKLSISWKYSKTFSAAKMSQQQPIKILKKFKVVFACKIVLAANHRYPGNFQRLFRLQNCRSRKSSKSWNYSKTFSAAKMSQQQPINILKIFKDFFACKNVLALNYRYPRNIQKIFRLQKCVSSNPSKFSKYSKTLSPAELSQPQIIDILEIFKDFFACKIVVAATHQYSENVQKLFRLQKCRSLKSAISWKN